MGRVPHRAWRSAALRCARTGLHLHAPWGSRVLDARCESSFFVFLGAAHMFVTMWHATTDVPAERLQAQHSATGASASEAVHTLLIGHCAVWQRATRPSHTEARAYRIITACVRFISCAARAPNFANKAPQTGQRLNSIHPTPRRLPFCFLGIGKSS